MVKIITPEQSIEILNNGGLVVCPTDTIWGFGCSIWNYKAIKKIREIKGKGTEFMSIAVNSTEELGYFAELDSKKKGKIKDLLKEGSYYTFVLNKRFTNDCLNLINCSKKIGIRVIKHPAVEIITKYAGPVITTSANIHNMPAIKDIESLDKKLIDSAYLVKGNCYWGKASKVYDVEEDRMIRQ